MKPYDAARAKSYAEWLRWKRATEYQPRVELWRQGLPGRPLTTDFARVTFDFDWGCKRPQLDRPDETP